MPRPKDAPELEALGVALEDESLTVAVESFDPWSGVTPADPMEEARGDWEEIPDGPVPAPQDAPARVDTLQWRAQRPELPKNEIRMQRKVGLRAELKPAPSTKIEAHPQDPLARRYPLFWALLRNPEQAVQPKVKRPPPVPRTFFPAPRVPLERAAPEDLDTLLATMAEGLLIGESADGGTEVRVTLKDEFFAGTELWISVGGGEISATLVPPDRQVYWTLNAHAEELAERLGARGLRVAKVEIREP